MRRRRSRQRSRRSRSRRRRRSRRRSRRRLPQTRSMTRKRTRSRPRRYVPDDFRTRFVTISHLWSTAGDKPRGVKSWASRARKRIKKKRKKLLTRCPVLTKGPDGKWKPCGRGVQLSGKRTHGAHVITGGTTGIIITCNHHNPKTTQHRQGGQKKGTNMKVKKSDMPRCFAAIDVSGNPPATPFEKPNRKGRRLSKSFFSP